MALGTRDSSRAMAFGEALLMTPTSVSGLSRKPMGMASTAGRTETGTRASGTCA